PPSSMEELYANTINVCTLPRSFLRQDEHHGCARGVKKCTLIQSIFVHSRNPSCVRMTPELLTRFEEMYANTINVCIPPRSFLRQDDPMVVHVVWRTCTPIQSMFV